MLIFAVKKHLSKVKNGAKKIVAKLSDRKIFTIFLSSSLLFLLLAIALFTYFTVHPIKTDVTKGGSGSFYTYFAPDVWANSNDYDIAQVLSSVQAIVNKSSPTLFVLESKGHQQFYLDELKKPGKFLAGKSEIRINSFAELIGIFKNQIDGAVVWGEDCWATKNVAVTVAGADGRKLVILRKNTDPNSIYSLMTKPVDQGGFGTPVLIDLTNKFTGNGIIWETKIASTGSKKNDAYRWAIEKYIKTGKVDPNLAAYRADGYWFYKTQVRRSPDVGYIYDNDYLISHRAFVFDLDPWPDEKPLDDPKQPLGTDFATMRAIYEQMYMKSDKNKLIKTIGFPPFTQKYSSDAPSGPTGLKSKHVAWLTEWEFVEVASKYNSFLEADIEGTYNTSFFQHIPKISYTQTPPFTQSKKSLYDKGYLTKTGGLVNKRYVLLTSSDFDSVSWMQYHISGGTDIRLWSDSQRGLIPIAWAFNPQLVERVPNIFNYLYETRSTNDFFVGGDSGAGYLNPSFLLAENKFRDGPVIIQDGVTPWINNNKYYYQLLDYTMTNNVINGNAGNLNQPKIINRLGEFSPGGVTALDSTKITGYLHNDVPFIKEARSGEPGIDPGLPAQTIANRIKEEVSARKFNQFRTILIPPTTLIAAINIVKQSYSDVEVVDPYTFFELLRINLGVDTVPPACNFCINDCQSTTSSVDISLGTPINYNDYPPNATGVDKIRFSNDLSSWIEYDIPLAPKISWKLIDGVGLKTVYMQAKDKAGNWGNVDSQDNYCFSQITLSDFTPAPIPSPTVIPTSAPTSEPETPMPTSTPLSKVVAYVYASGTSTDGQYPTMELKLNGSTICQWKNVKKYTGYTCTLKKVNKSSDLRAALINASFISNVKRVLTVDKIVINGKTFETEDPSTYTYRVKPLQPWCQDDGYLKTESTECNGDFKYDLSSL